MEKQIVYLVVTSLDNDGDPSVSPEVSVFSSLCVAREYMRFVKDDDNVNGITSTLDVPDEEWEVSDEDDRFYARNENANKWINIQIQTKEVERRCPCMCLNRKTSLHVTEPNTSQVHTDTLFPTERMEFSKEHHAMEIHADCDKAPPILIYRSDLYSSREDALAAFANPETREAITVLCNLQQSSSALYIDPPFELSGEYDEVDDYSSAYFDNVPEVVDAVNKIIGWVDGNEIKPGWLLHGVTSFISHD